MLLWCLALGGLYSAFVFLSMDQRPLAAVGFVLAIVLPGVAETYAQRRRRNDHFSREFGSQEDFVRALDTDALRRLRDEKGVLEAVREVRRRHPKVPLKNAADAVKGL